MLYLREQQHWMPMRILSKAIYGAEQMGDGVNTYALHN